MKETGSRDAAAAAQYTGSGRGGHVAENAINLLIGGEAGQGLVTVGRILAKSLVRGGYYIVVTQSYMSRVRGVHNSFAIGVGGSELYAPRESIDLLVALNPETVSLHGEELSPEGLIVVDEAFGIDDSRCFKLPFEQLAERKFYNIAALGGVAALLGLDVEIVSGMVKDFFGKRHPESVEENRRVLSETFKWCSQKRVLLPEHNRVVLFRIRSIRLRLR